MIEMKSYIVDSDRPLHMADVKLFIHLVQMFQLKVHASTTTGSYSPWNLYNYYTWDM